MQWVFNKCLLNGSIVSYALLIPPEQLSPYFYDILSVFTDISNFRFSSFFIWSIAVTTSLELLFYLICFIKHLQSECFSVAYKFPHDLLHAYLPFNTFPVYALQIQYLIIFINSLQFHAISNMLTISIYRKFCFPSAPNAVTPQKQALGLIHVC